MITARYEFPEGSEIKSVKLRETNGLDEAKASQQAKLKGNPDQYVDELVKLSIVEVDDQPVSQPWDKLDQLSSKTRTLIAVGYNKLNKLEDTDVEGFLASAQMTV